MPPTDPSTLPNPRTFLSSLLPTLSPAPSPSPPSSQSTSPLQPHQKPLLLTLHCLFPNELLPALDLLDRRLVSRLILEHDTGAEKNGPASDAALAEAVGAEEERASRADDDALVESEKRRRQMSVYYVRSSYASRSRYSAKRNESSAAEGMSYEVRLHGWNCTCAAFAFAAFSGEPGGDAKLIDSDGRESLRERDDGDWSTGGSSLGHDVPVCKHLLACILAERVRGLETLVEERIVSREEMAGYAAGWMG